MSTGSKSEETPLSILARVNQRLAETATDEDEATWRRTVAAKIDELAAGARETTDQRSRHPADEPADLADGSDARGTDR